MFRSLSAQELFDREFLDLRCHILDLAASFDRIERADEFHIVHDDTRLEQLHQAVKALVDSGTDRAGRVQMIFSKPYSENWRQS